MFRLATSCGTHTCCHDSRSNILGLIKLHNALKKNGASARKHGQTWLQLASSSPLLRFKKKKGLKFTGSFKRVRVTGEEVFFLFKICGLATAMLLINIAQKHRHSKNDMRHLEGAAAY